MSTIYLGVSPSEISTFFLEILYAFVSVVILMQRCQVESSSTWQPEAEPCLKYNLTCDNIGEDGHLCFEVGHLQKSDKNINISSLSPSPRLPSHGVPGSL